MCPDGLGNTRSAQSLAWHGSAFSSALASSSATRKGLHQVDKLHPALSRLSTVPSTPLDQQRRDPEREFLLMQPEVSVVGAMIT